MLLIQSVIEVKKKKGWYMWEMFNVTIKINYLYRDIVTTVKLTP